MPTPKAQGRKNPDAWTRARSGLGGCFFALAQQLDGEVVGTVFATVLTFGSGRRAGGWVDRRHGAGAALAPLPVLLLLLLGARSATQQVEAIVELDDDRGFLGQHDLGAVGGFQEVGRVVRQHHVDAAESVVHLLATVAHVQAVTHEITRQQLDIVVEQGRALTGLQRVGEKGL